jgi:hypothetical protein
MPIKVHTTNEPDDEKEVDEAEFIDLARLGLIVAGKGDVNENGDLKRAAAKEASPEVKAATGQQPVLTQNGGQ